MTPTARRWTRFGAIGLIVLAFVPEFMVWHWPYDSTAMLNEVLVLGLTLLAGAALLPLLGGLAALVVTALLYGTLTLAGLGVIGEAGIGFGRFQYVLFSAPGCEFTARFASPPRWKEGVLQAPDGPAIPAYLATWSDFDHVMAWRAECFALPDSKGADLATMAEAWTNNAGIQRAEIDLDERAGTRIARITGTLGGSILPSADGGPRRTLIAARLYAGERSVLGLMVADPRARGMVPETTAFLESARRRP